MEIEVQHEIEITESTISLLKTAIINALGTPEDGISNTERNTVHAFLNFNNERGYEYAEGHKKALGIEWELDIDNQLKKLTDNSFRRGKQNSEPDFVSLSSDYPSFELKTKERGLKKVSLPQATGNKAYVKDKEGRKSKNHYYIVINYKLEENKVTHYKYIKKIKAWVGYIKQSDWNILNNDGTEIKGSSASLSEEAKKSLKEILCIL